MVYNLQNKTMRGSKSGFQMDISLSSFKVLIFQRSIVRGGMIQMMIMTLWSTLSFAQTTSYFSAIVGQKSKVDSIMVASTEVNQIKVAFSGDQAQNFKHVSTALGHGNNQGKSIIKYQFEPGKESLGISRASLDVQLKNKPIANVLLRGIGIAALEGENEPSLAQILDVLDIATDIGWKSLANHTKSTALGEEIEAKLFRKAHDGDVKISPLARYSPPSQIPFGYYYANEQGPHLVRVGVLSDSKKFHEHQTLFPTIDGGSKGFNPKNKTFGFYAASPTHVSCTEDVWNILNSSIHASHATRIYPVRGKNGALVPNSYLICFEEAANGDYQDYVFLVENVIPIDPQHQFDQLLNNNLDGWDIYLEDYGLNKDPNKMFAVEENVLRVDGKDVGYIITDKSYDNFHFKLEFKWGEKKWPPRLQNKRDSGICYHISDEDENRVWPNSVECQIQEGDVGDFWLLGFNTIEVNGKQNAPNQYSSIVKSKDNEKPNGEWNTVEVISFNGTCVHIVNGMVVNFGVNSSLKKGRILLQSEWAELYYRNVAIREL